MSPRRSHVHADRPQRRGGRPRQQPDQPHLRPDQRASIDTWPTEPCAYGPAAAPHRQPRHRATFQNIELLEHATVLQNLLIGWHAHRRTALRQDLLFTRRTRGGDRIAREGRARDRLPGSAAPPRPMVAGRSTAPEGRGSCPRCTEPRRCRSTSSHRGQPPRKPKTWRLDSTSRTTWVTVLAVRARHELRCRKPDRR